MVRPGRAYLLACRIRSPSASRFSVTIVTSKRRRASEGCERSRCRRALPFPRRRQSLRVRSLGEISRSPSAPMKQILRHCLRPRSVLALAAFLPFAVAAAIPTRVYIGTRAERASRGIYLARHDPTSGILGRRALPPMANHRDSSPSIPIAAFSMPSPVGLNSAITTAVASRLSASIPNRTDHGCSTSSPRGTLVPRTSASIQAGGWFSRSTTPAANPMAQGSTWRVTINRAPGIGEWDCLMLNPRPFSRQMAAAPALYGAPLPT